MPSGYATGCPTLGASARLCLIHSIPLPSLSHSRSLLSRSPRYAYLVVAKNRPCHGHRRHFKKLKPHKRPGDDELRTEPADERISASSRYRHWPVAPSRELVSPSALPPVVPCHSFFRPRSVGTWEIIPRFSSIDPL